MKTKILVSFFTLGVMLFNPLNCKGNQLQDSISEVQVLSMLKSFYTSYIIENSKVPDDFKKINSIKHKYCTTSLLHKIKKLKLDYDMFLQANDIDSVMLKTLDVKKDSIRNNLYYVSYLDIFNNKTVTINLMVIKQKEDYKIDAVWYEEK